ncbi:MAG TPA: helix-turn-helix domain-containing protein [Dehalococcoidia bacterium]|nr:helix-turn-helix domain-containing protein [Dehalococcoidia bacterium]
MTRIAQVSASHDLRPAAAGSGWITLAQACRVLGVNESTLRRWADAGQVRTFRTPGGHRRFSESDLLSLTTSGPAAGDPERANLADLALTRIRRRLQRPRQSDATWYQQLSDEERLRLRLLGRRLVSLISDYFTRRTRRLKLLEEARAIGREYGRELGMAGTPLRDALAAFMFFRRSLDETARQLALRNGLSTDETVDGLEHISDLADEVLLAITEAYAAPAPRHGV